MVEGDRRNRWIWRPGPSKRWPLTVASHLDRLLGSRGRNHRRQDLPVPPNAEESLPAGVAAIGGEMQQALGEEQGAFVHPVAGNVVQIEIPAPWTVSESAKPERHSPGIKSSVAGMASPGTRPGEREGEVDRPGSMRAKTVCAAALRTDHKFLTSAIRHRITKRIFAGNVSRRRVARSESRVFSTARVE